MNFLKKLETALGMQEIVAENAALNLVVIGIVGVCWLLHKGVQHILNYRFKCKKLESRERTKMKEIEAAKSQRRKPKKKRR